MFEEGQLVKAFLNLVSLQLDMFIDWNLALKVLTSDPQTKINYSSDNNWSKAELIQTLMLERGRLLAPVSLKLPLPPSQEAVLSVPKFTFDSSKCYKHENIS